MRLPDDVAFELEDAYADAWEEWTQEGGEVAWSAATDDGIAAAVR